MSRHALITGAGSGIGATTARRLHSDGLRLTLLGRDRSKLDAVAASLPNAHVVIADVTDEAALTAAFASARERHGPVEVLINNAGGVASAPFLKTDAAAWTAAVALNLQAPAACARLVLPDMLAAGWGRIVNLASTAGLKGYPYVSAYVAAKHGLVGLTRALALEVASKGVTVNAVCPGFTDTPLIDRSIDAITAKSGRSADDARAALASANPQGRLVTPAEVADAIAWLCSDAAGGVNGAAVPISGGEV